MDKLTGGQSTKMTVDDSQKAAEEAAKRVKQATDEANKMLLELRTENAKESGYAYQQESMKLMSDVAEKAAKIRKLQSEGAPTTSIQALKAELNAYTADFIKLGNYIIRNIRLEKHYCLAVGYFYIAYAASLYTKAHKRAEKIAV